MPAIKKRDRPAIAEWFNIISDRVTESIEKFSTALLTIFTPVTSGLAFLSTTLIFDSTYQQYTFATLITSSGLIVFVALWEKFIRTLISQHIYKQFIDHLNETGELLSKPIGGKTAQEFVLKNASVVLFVLIIINVLAMLLFSYSFIF